MSMALTRRPSSGIPAAVRTLPEIVPLGFDIVLPPIIGRPCRAAQPPLSINSTTITAGAPDFIDHSRGGSCNASATTPCDKLRRVANTTLISTDTLASHLNDDSWFVVDCRYNLKDEEWGRAQYLAGHIPGAVFVDLAHDLAAPRTGANGRHPLPSPEAMADTFGRLGIGA